MSEETKKAPAIRFQGFTDDWEQRNILEISKVFIGLVTTMTENYRNEGTLLIRNSDIKENRFEFSDNPIHLDEAFAENNSSRRLIIGDVITIHTGDIGTSAVIGEREDGAIGFATINTRPNQDVLDSNYLSTYFNTEKHKNYAIKVSTGDGRSNYNLKDFNRLSVPLPLLDEQKKIGFFFKQLNDTIALHLCKQRQLELLKQRLIKEILPQIDSTLPHLRFANFRKPWEQHQLKEVLKVNSGRDYKHLNEGNIPVYGTGGYMLSVDGKLSDVDGIGLGRKGTIDKPQYLKAPFWTVDTLFYLTPSPNYDIYFLYTLIQNVNWKSMDESTGVPSLSKSVIERVTLTFPILEEQQKIGSFFREFDNTISLHQQKIAHLKALKSTILNKMFI